MSKDFASFMASISEDSAEQRINELMEILDKVMQIIMNSVDQLTVRIQGLEGNIHNVMNRVAKVEATPRAAAPGVQGAPGAAAAA